MLAYDLYYCLRSMVTYIEQAPAPLLWAPDKKTRVIDLPDFKLACKTLEEAKLLFDVKTMIGPEFIDSSLDPH